MTGWLLPPQKPLQELGGEMQFVIVRPGGLKSEPGTGKGVLTEDTTGEDESRISHG